MWQQPKTEQIWTIVILGESKGISAFQGAVGQEETMGVHVG